jgi:hypothetical protein
MLLDFCACADDNYVLVSQPQLMCGRAFWGQLQPCELGNAFQLFSFSFDRLIPIESFQENIQQKKVFVVNTVSVLFPIGLHDWQIHMCHVLFTNEGLPLQL